MVKGITDARGQKAAAEKKTKEIKINKK